MSSRCLWQRNGTNSRESLTVHSLARKSSSTCSTARISPLDVDLYASGTIWSRRRFKAPRRESALSIAAPDRVSRSFYPCFPPPCPQVKRGKSMGTVIASSRTAVRLEPDNIRSIQRAGGGSQAPLQTSGHQAAAGSPASILPKWLRNFSMQTLRQTIQHRLASYKIPASRRRFNRIKWSRKLTKWRTISSFLSVSTYKSNQSND
jgi:hypothetical protein